MPTVHKWVLCDERLGSRGDPPKLNAGDGDPGRGPTADRRSGFACLLFGLEQDEREALALGRLQPIANDEASRRADLRQDVARERLGCRGRLIRIDRQAHQCRVHHLSSRRRLNLNESGPACEDRAHTSAMPTEPWWLILSLALLFAAPWIAAVFWVCARSPRAMWDEHPPSMAEMARRHLSTD